MQRENLPFVVRESSKVIIRKSWSPPTFDAAFVYIEKCVTLRDEVRFLCKFNDNLLEVLLTGRVSCIGTGRAYLKGQGSMRITRDNKTTKITVRVLGSVLGFGTAVLIDENDNVWLYNPPDTVYTPLPNFPQQAVMILEKGETGGSHKTLILDDCYDAIVEIDESAWRIAGGAQPGGL